MHTEPESILTRGDLLLDPADTHEKRSRLIAVTAITPIGELGHVARTSVAIVGTNNKRWEHLHVFQHN